MASHKVNCRSSDKLDRSILKRIQCRCNLSIAVIELIVISAHCGMMCAESIINPFVDANLISSFV